MRPAGLAAVTAAMSVLNLTAFVMADDAGAFALVVTGVVVAVSYLVLWHFWRGRNWARWLVMITSLVALLNLEFIAEVTWPLQVVIVVEAVLGLFLLYWLNTKAVRAYFTQVRLPTSD